MKKVIEILDTFPVEDTEREIARNEETFFSKPHLGPVKLLEHDLLGVVHFPTLYQPSKFAPPMGVYECDHIRLEWQKMGYFRQPFYHRNADVDELSYQIFGERTLMTEYGTVELTPGDFTRIPVGVAHDNYGRDEIHLLFYIPAPVVECGPVKDTGKLLIPPFEGWTAKTVPEVMTECLGGPECDIAAFMTDEELLLQHAAEIDPGDLIKVLRADVCEGTCWIYKAKHVWIGQTVTTSRSPAKYRRHRACDEIQCQIKGKRTLVSQRGTLELEPGDFVSIPKGVAFCDIVEESSVHITVLTLNPAPPKAVIIKTAVPTTGKSVEQLRERSVDDVNGQR